MVERVQCKPENASKTPIRGIVEEPPNLLNLKFRRYNSLFLLIFLFTQKSQNSYFFQHFCSSRFIHRHHNHQAHRYPLRHHRENLDNRCKHYHLLLTLIFVTELIAFELYQSYQNIRLAHRKYL